MDRFQIAFARGRSVDLLRVFHFRAMGFAVILPEDLLIIAVVGMHVCINQVYGYIKCMYFICENVKCVHLSLCVYIKCMSHCMCVCVYIYQVYVSLHVCV